FPGTGARGGLGVWRGASFAQRSRTRRHSRHARSHSLQNRQERADPAHQQKNPSRQTQEVRFELNCAPAKSPMKIHLVLLGKTRRPEIRALLDDYAARIGRFADVQLTELREDSAASLRKLALDSAATVVLLDDTGKRQTSAQFAGWLGETRDRGAREIVFL